MSRRASLVVAGLVVMSIATSCAVSRDDLVESFAASNPGATDEQSTCVVDELIDHYGVDGVETELTADPVAETFEEQQLRSMVHCGLTDMVREPLLAQLVALDVPQESRACVADELTADISDADLDVLLSGEITEQFYARFFDALTNCEALP